MKRLLFFSSRTKSRATIKLKELTASDRFPPAELLLETARPLWGADGVWTDSEIVVYSPVHDDPVLRQGIEKQLDRIEHVTASRAPSRWATHGNSWRPGQKTRRWPKPASGSSRTASSAGIWGGRIVLQDLVMSERGRAVT